MPARTASLYIRALRLRCPACGSGPVFLSWFRMCPNCPACGQHFDREPQGGYWVGSYTINLMVTEATLALVFVSTLFLTWPTPPWDLLLYEEIGIALTLPALIYPFTKTLFIAIDLTFRPDEPEDFQEPREAGYKRKQGAGS